MQISKTRTTGLLVAMFALVAGPVASGSAHEIWVTNIKSGDVTVIDVSSLKAKATIKTGKGAHNVTLSRDGKQAFVANVGEATVSIIDTGHACHQSRWKDPLCDEP